MFPALGTVFLQSSKVEKGKTFNLFKQNGHIDGPMQFKPVAPGSTLCPFSGTQGLGGAFGASVF